MKYLTRIIRGMCAGVILFIVAYGTSLLVGNLMYPLKFDTVFISKDAGSFSQSSLVHNTAMPTIFIVTILIYTVVYIAVYLYLRNRYYKKLGQVDRPL